MGRNGTVPSTILMEMEPTGFFEPRSDRVEAASSREENQPSQDTETALSASNKQSVGFPLNFLCRMDSIRVNQ